MDFLTDFQLTSKTGVNFFSHVKCGIKCIIFLQEAKKLIEVKTQCNEKWANLKCKVQKKISFIFFIFKFPIQLKYIFT